MKLLMKNQMIQMLVLVLGLGFQSSHGFDLEDYASTMRATRDALLKANKELRISENDLISIINANPRLPMRISTHSKIGSGIGCCCYQKDCSVVNTKENQLKLFDSTVKNGSKLKNVELAFTEGLYRVDVVDKLREEIVNYHNRIDPNILASQETLLTDQPSTALFDQEINDQVINNGFSQPFGANAWDKMEQFRALRDSYMKSLNEVKLAKPPFLAARAAYAEAFRHYYNNSNCSKPFNFGITFDEFISNLGGY